MKRVNVISYDVLVGNFSKNAPNDSLEKKVSKHFTKYGETKGFFVKDNNAGKYVVVRYFSEPDADRAVSEANGMLLEGTPLLVKRMERRSNKPDMRSSGETPHSGGTWISSKDSTAAQKKPFGKNPDIVPQVEPTGSSSPGPDGESYVSPAASLSNLSGSSPSMSMHIAFIETPTLLWCLEASGEVLSQQDEISQKLSTICPTAPRLVGEVDFSKLYGAQFTEDELWYRCQVKGKKGQDKVRVQYVDFGNSEDQCMKDLRELPADLAHIKPIVQKVMLHNTRYLNSKEKEAHQFLTELTAEQFVTVTPTFQTKDGGGMFAHVHLNNIDLGQTLIEKGFATTKPPKKDQQQPQQQQYQKPFHPQKQQQKDFAPSSQFHLGQGGGYASSTLGHKFGSGDASNRFSALTSIVGRPVTMNPADKSMSGPRFAGMSQGSPMKGGGEKKSLLGDPSMLIGQPVQTGPTGPSYSDLKIELQNKDRALQRASNETAATNTKIDNLKREYQGLAAKLEENNLSCILKSATSLAKKVSHMRNQFSEEKPTIVDEAIELACSADKLTENSVASLPATLECLTKYRAMQDEICKMKTKEDIDLAKLEERDGMRRTAYDQLALCISEMKKTPFTDRVEQITQCTEKLMVHYDNFFSIPVEGDVDFEAAVAQYHEFKANKKREFEQARLRTDQQLQEVQEQMAMINKGISLSVDEAVDLSSIDLVAALRQYCLRMQSEVSIRSVDTGKSGKLLAALVQAVQRDLKSQILCVNDLIRFEAEFQATQASMEGWLENKPSVERLLENRQLLRTLKSKLRHKLADKNDAEENDEKEALEDIQKEVVDIQTEIHKALLTEDEELAELARLADSHFPELFVLHADCGLDVQLKYKGLVKMNYEVSHYNLTPVSGCVGRMFFSKFADQDILIMECLLSDGHHLSREDFLLQLMSYTSIQHPALLQPVAVFFDKNNRHAYLHFERDGDILAYHVQYGQFQPSMASVLVRCLAEGLSALHRKKVLHGEVNPFSILHYPDGSARLLPPDLTCQALDRARSRFTSTSGLEFLAPETQSVQSGADLRGSVDMYCIGILLLYLDSPNQTVSFCTDGSLDVSKFHLEASLVTLVKSLTSHLSNLRPTADMLLQTQYICQTSRPDTDAAVSGGTCDSPAPPLSAPQQSAGSSPALHCPQSQSQSLINACSAATRSSSPSPVTTLNASSPPFIMPDTQHPPPHMNNTQHHPSPHTDNTQCPQPHSDNTQDPPPHTENMQQYPPPHADNMQQYTSSHSDNTQYPPPYTDNTQENPPPNTDNSQQYPTPHSDNMQQYPPPNTDNTQYLALQSDNAQQYLTPYTDNTQYLTSYTDNTQYLTSYTDNTQYPTALSDTTQHPAFVNNIQHTPDNLDSRHTPPPFVNNTQHTSAIVDSRQTPPPFVNTQPASPLVSNVQHPQNMSDNIQQPSPFVNNAQHTSAVLDSRHTPPPFVNTQHASPLVSNIHQTIADNMQHPPFVNNLQNTSAIVESRHTPPPFVNTQHMSPLVSNVHQTLADNMQHPPPFVNTQHALPLVDDIRQPPPFFTNVQPPPSAMDNIQLSTPFVDSTQPPPFVVNNTQQPQNFVNNIQHATPFVDNTQPPPAFVSNIQHPPHINNFQQPPPPLPSSYPTQREPPICNSPQPSNVFNLPKPAESQFASMAVSSALSSFSDGSAGYSANQGSFEIGTFSIDDVNGTDNSKGRKITGQAVVEEEGVCAEAEENFAEKQGEWAGMEGWSGTEEWKGEEGKDDDN